MLLVIAIIAILAGIVIVAINPGRQLAQSRNAQRWNDIRSLHSAVQQYYIDNKEWPLALQTTEIDGTMVDVCRSGETSGCLDLESDLVPNYLSAIPEDPQASTTSTLYRIGINPTSKTPNIVATESTEYGLEEVKILTECGNPANEGCWSDEGNKSWGPSPSISNANSDTNGRLNTEILVAMAESFPAAQFCEDSTYGGYIDWYLPAKNQLFSGWQAQQNGEFSNVIFNTAVDYYSSTESITNPSFNVWVLNPNYDRMDPFSKPFANQVRCLR